MLNNMPSQAKLLDMAYEELVSDALTDMLTDGSIVNFIAEVKAQDRKLWQKIKDAIKSLLEKWGFVIDSYKGHDLETAEARALSQFEDAFKTLQKMYQEAFVDANNAVAKIGSKAASEQTLTESGIAVGPETDGEMKLSERDSGGSTPSKNKKTAKGSSVVEISISNTEAEKFNNMTDAEKSKYIYSYIVEHHLNDVFYLSDGVEAIVDKKDLDKFAHTKYVPKLLIGYNFKEVVEAAKLYDKADNVEHSKFSSFKYYRTNFKIGDITYNGVVNVGFGKFDKRYHIYDINQINEDGSNNARPKSEEQGVSPSSNNNISQPTQNSQVKLSERDKQYVNFAKDPDANEEALRKMVDSAAKATGYTIKAYHGTPTGDFSIFDKTKSSGNNDLGQAFYFSTNQTDAELYRDGLEKGDKKKSTRKVFGVYLKINAPFVISDNDRISLEKAKEILVKGIKDEKMLVQDAWYYLQLNAKDGTVTTEQFRHSVASLDIAWLLEKAGYDGIIDKTVSQRFNEYFENESTHIAVFNSNQIKSSDPITYDDSGNVIPLSERFNTQNEDIRYSERFTDQSSKYGRFDDEQRYEDLKNKKIKLVSSQISQGHPLMKDIENVPEKAKSQVEQYIYKLASNLGILNKPLATTDLDIEFQISKTNGIKKSLNDQLKYGGNFQDFAKALINLGEILNNAVLIESHFEDRYKGTIREDINFKAGHVLLGGFVDGENIIPVKLEIKQKKDSPNTLYLVVAMTKIKRTSVMGSTLADKKMSSILLPDTDSIYSLPQIISKINPKDRHFLKYFPNQMLSPEQAVAKQVALKEDADKLDKILKKDEDKKSSKLSEREEVKYSIRTNNNGEGRARYNSRDNVDFDYDARISYSHRADQFSYETLISKPDMKLTTVEGVVPKNRADVVFQAKKNAESVGKRNKNGSVSVYVDDLGVDVLLGTDGLKHGLRRVKKPQDSANFMVTLKAGEIIKNSIKINEMLPTKENASGSYVLIGVARNATGDLYIVRSVVNQFNNELDSMDVIYAINTKKEELAVTKSPRSTAKPLSVTSSTISISDLLDYVNKYFPDMLPESVLRHYGYNTRPDGDFSEDILFSERDTDVSNRVILSQALESVAQNDIEIETVGLLQIILLK